MAFGDISDFVTVRTYKGHAWVAKAHSLRMNGHTFENGGFATKPCACCGSNAVIGLYTKKDGMPNDDWFDSCAACGYTVEEMAVYELEESHG